MSDTIETLRALGAFEPEDLIEALRDTRNVAVRYRKDHGLDFAREVLFGQPPPGKIFKYFNEVFEGLIDAAVAFRAGTTPAQWDSRNEELGRQAFQLGSESETFAELLTELTEPGARLCPCGEWVLPDVDAGENIWHEIPWHWSEHPHDCEHTPGPEPVPEPEPELKLEPEESWDTEGKLQAFHALQGHVVADPENQTFLEMFLMLAEHLLKPCSAEVCAAVANAALKNSGAGNAELFDFIRSHQSTFRNHRGDKHVQGCLVAIAGGER